MQASASKSWAVCIHVFFNSLYIHLTHGVHTKTTKLSSTVCVQLQSGTKVFCKII